jgi:hypothetical protein
MKTKLVEAAESNGIPHEFADFWADVYLETRDFINLDYFIEWVKAKYARRTAKDT